MYLHIDPHSGVPIYVQIMDQVRLAVAGGLLAPGDRLPSVRELALRLTINPNTVARAYAELERKGVILTLQGRGTFVAEPAVAMGRAERERELAATIDRLAAEARNLGFDQQETEALIKAGLERWFRRGAEREASATKAPDAGSPGAGVPGTVAPPPAPGGPEPGTGLEPPQAGTGPGPPRPPQRP